MKLPTIIHEPRLAHPHYPTWVFDRHTAETLDDAGFLSGSALALLNSVLIDPGSSVPPVLLRKRLALGAAKNCLKLEGRNENASDIRDAFYLARPGEARGPSGDMLELWYKACSMPLRNGNWKARFSTQFPIAISERLPELIDLVIKNDASKNPVTQAAQMLAMFANEFPRSEVLGLVCADAILARSLGWTYLVPLLSRYVKTKLFRDLHSGVQGHMAKPDDYLTACHEAIGLAARDAYRLAHELSRRSAQLRMIAPKLKAKGADAAVDLFLKEDVVLPSSMLSPVIKGTNKMMTDRSARRFCERLVELGVVREQTGRSTFRLYGI